MLSSVVTTAPPHERGRCNSVSIVSSSLLCYSMLSSFFCCCEFLWDNSSKWYCAFIYFFSFLCVVALQNCLGAISTGLEKRLSSGETNKDPGHILDIYIFFLHGIWFFNFNFSFLHSSTHHLPRCMCCSGIT